MENQPNWSQDVYVKAHHFAAQAHCQQTIRDTEIPYLAHLHLVAMEVVAAIGNDQQYDGNFALQCALLHDTIEDTEVTFEQVSREFGDRVAQGVLALTKDESLAKELQIADSLRRIKLQPQEVWIVKLADRISNLQIPPTSWSQEKIANYRQDAVLIYEQLKAGHAGLAARLLNKINNYCQV